MSFEVVYSQVNNPILIKSKIYFDARGHFLETYKKSDFVSIGILDDFVQDNLSKSVKNVLRGMHYQINPKAQGKLVTCLKGEILDVFVDMRKGSSIYGKAKNQLLSEESGLILYIPAGFAHGFIVRSEEAIFLYKVTECYSPAHETGFVWNDPQINIEWGIDKPIVSEKDKILPLFKDATNNFEYK